MWAADTSLAIASIDPDHQHHAAARAACSERRPVLAGHAAFESYSVLTRLPGAARVDPATAESILTQAFGDPCWMPAATRRGLIRRLSTVGVSGGAVFDALVAVSAASNDRTLLSLDRRAASTYRRLDIDFELVT
ncbi:MAG: hypothetical protein HKN07_09280 [Acidimicrobiia bacterium]|nr:hypothetical protein [Acidimicrobiia bacterium]